MISLFFSHFYQLRKLYEDVAVVTLLGSKEGERLLGDAFKVSYFTHSVRYTDLKQSLFVFDAVRKTLEIFCEMIYPSQTQHSKCAPDVPFIAFDYHAEMKSSRENIERLKVCQIGCPFPIDPLLHRFTIAMHAT